MLVNLLKEQGLSEKESKIYLTCLELNSAPASTISRHSKEKRVTVYTLLKELTKKGIIKETMKHKIKYYSAISPEQLISKKEQKIKKFKDAIPEFLMLTNESLHKTKFYFHEGIEGIKNVYNDILKTQPKGGTKDTILSFLGTIDMDKHFENRLTSDFLPRDIDTSRKIDRNTPKVIIFDETTPYAKLNKKHYNTLTVPKTKRNVSNEIVVYGDKIAIFMYSHNDLSAITINSSTINHTLRSLFELIWNGYKK